MQCLLHVRMSLLSSDWDWLGTRIGDWDWGLRFGTGIGDEDGDGDGDGKWK